ncbi:MAG: cytochrome c maturation protein CcmE [Bryobacteraceae bacterium]|nr:cytochrome c maturation protein CcmE [Solibacteraceae bacterium]MCL4840962.1 cytochrome c maturation protein CcmE [Bryobacteraceae bacterium]MCO5351653.1 cytochrome c maturation protein CcmE [Bryobacteraceae bacterium]
MKTYAKFVVLIVGILGTLAWLAASGINESKTYYKTVAELKALQGDDAHKRVRVTGDVVAGTIKRDGGLVHFQIIDKETNSFLNVTYMGKDPLPDTFRDEAQAMADGKLSEDGTFHASAIAAKCPSKYEADTSKGQAAQPLNEKPSSI